MTDERAVSLLHTMGQSALASYLRRKDEATAQKIVSQLSQLDLSVIEKGGAQAVTDDMPISPLAVLELPQIKAREAELFRIGLQALADGKVGALLLAGGQGTRLGSDAPKGCYDIGLTRPYYIFQALFEEMGRVAALCGRAFPVYIQTSEKNHDETVAFLKEKQFFGYDAQGVFFFCQELSPVTDFAGNLLLEAPDRVATSPNGNGGWFSSMERAGLVEQAVAQGVEYLNVFAVDNVLQKIADPVFVGAVLEGGYQSGAKVVRKAEPQEKVGVLCERNGHPYIVEYYEMTEAMAKERNADGSLRFAFGVILNYLFSIRALRQTRSDLPIHRVEKKVPYLTYEGEAILPSAPNAYKYETLVLDLVAMMPNCLPFEVERSREFAPIKNRDGVDSVESARALLLQNGVVL